MAGVFKRMVVGRPLATTQMEEQRLPKTIALAVFSSDALSSTAYATEEILFVVAVGGSSLALGLSRLVPIAIVVAALLAIVIISYRQVIFAYPGGGGAYVVSQENLGEMASLIAGASLMVDYVLTVAVSISAGVAAIVSIPALSSLADHRVALGVVLILGTDAPFWLVNVVAGVVYAVTMPFVALTTAYVYFDARVQGALVEPGPAELPAEIELPAEAT